MATRSEEQRVMRWCMKHSEELLAEGVNINALLRVVLKHDVNAKPLPTSRGRKRGHISRIKENNIGNMNAISPYEFILTVCRLITRINRPEAVTVNIDNSGQWGCSFENAPCGFARLMMAFKKIFPEIENKALHRTIAESFCGYKVGAYSSFSRNCSKLDESDYILFVKHINEMNGDL